MVVLCDVQVEDVEPVPLTEVVRDPDKGCAAGLGHTIEQHNEIVLRTGQQR